MLQKSGLGCRDVEGDSRFERAEMPSMLFLCTRVSYSAEESSKTFVLKTVKNGQLMRME